MKINYLNSTNYCNSIASRLNTAIKQDKLTFCADVPDCNFVSDWEMQKQYSDGLLSKHTVYKTDENGELVLDKRNKPITVIDPKIKAELDKALLEFEGPDGKPVICSIKDAVKMHAIDDMRARKDDGFSLFHGTSREAIQNIIKNGPDLGRCSRSAFGPGMYFAFSEGCAEDYSSAKLLADIFPTVRKNGKKGRFVRFNTDYYDKISSKGTQKLRELLNLELTSKDFGPNIPYYIAMVKMEVPYKIFDYYFRDLIVNELNIDAADCSSRGYHSCMVVFNPDAIHNIREY